MSTPRNPLFTGSPGRYEVSDALSGSMIREAQRAASRIMSEMAARIDAEVVANFRAAILGADPANYSPTPITADSIREVVATLRRSAVGAGRQDSYWDQLYRAGHLVRLRAEQAQMIKHNAKDCAWRDQACEQSLVLAEKDTIDRAEGVRRLRVEFADPESGLLPGGYLLMRRLQIGLADLVPEGQPFFEPTTGPHGNDAIQAMARTVGRLIADWPKATGRFRTLGVRGC